MNGSLPRHAKECSIYIISQGDVGPVKIGISATPWGRVMDLQCGNPAHLTLVWHQFCDSRHDAECWERDAHEFLGALRMQGEWFDIEPRYAIPAVLSCVGPVDDPDWADFEKML